MLKIYSLFCAALLLGCSSTVVSSGIAEAGAGGADATGGSDTGGASATGGSGASTGGAAAGATTGGTGAAGSASTGGAAGSGGTAGQTATGGAAGAPAGSVPVDVAAGVVTSCVFPSAILLPIFTACEPGDVGLPVDTCATPANPELPITLSDLVWDYSTLTLKATLTIDSTFSVAFGACSAPTTCDYKLYVNAPSPPDPQRVTINMAKNDRGYVVTNIQNMGAKPVDASCSNSYGQGNVSLCVQNGYWRSWADWSAPCAGTNP